MCLQKWTDGENHLYVDIPIDLQGLPRVRNPLYVWQTKLRVVDYVVGGLPSFATFIGSQTADFHFLAAQADVLGKLGTSLFETYPKATVESAFGKEYPGYKGRKATDAGRIEMQKLLGISNPSENLNDDEIDAIICVLPGVVRTHSLTEKDLASRWNRAPKDLKDVRTIKTERPSFFTPPAGYRILLADETWRGPKLFIERKGWSNYEIA